MPKQQNPRKRQGALRRWLFGQWGVFRVESLQPGREREEAWMNNNEAISKGKSHLQKVWHKHVTCQPEPSFPLTEMDAGLDKRELGEEVR